MAEKKLGHQIWLTIELCLMFHSWARHLSMPKNFRVSLMKLIFLTAFPSSFGPDYRMKTALVDHLKKEVGRGSMYLLIFLDLSGAFKPINYDIFLKFLRWERHNTFCNHSSHSHQRSPRRWCREIAVQHLGL